MDKVIDGKTYKQMKVAKIVINGKEKEGAIIDSKDTKSSGEATVTIVAQKDENSDEKK